MSNTRTTFLPITDGQLTTMAAAQGPVRIKEIMSAWSVATVAAATVLQNLTSFQGQSNPQFKIEKKLAELISVAISLEGTHPPGTFHDLMAQRLNILPLIQGAELAPDLGIRLMDQELLEAEGYLLRSGEWDLDFCTRHSKDVNPYTEQFATNTGKTFSLTNQQARSFKVFCNEPDESMHIQGLAGTGKSFLIERMIDSLSRYRPLVLAYTKVQLAALMSRIGAERVTGVTFGELAQTLLERDKTKLNRRAGHRALPRHQVAFDVVASRLGFGQVNVLRPEQVASLCARMVSRFCFSQDAGIHEGHIPKMDLNLTGADKAVLVSYATFLWEQTIEPTDKGYDLPLRGYHRIKHLSLDPEAYIDPEYTHLIVDEAHDLSWPMTSFLDRCTQPLITLGDACQRLDCSVSKRAAWVRQREVTHSIRAGRQIEGVINSLIDQNPLVRVSPIEGSRQRDTRILYYDRADIPERPTTILVSSEWGLFEWFQRLGSANAPFSLLPGAEPTFRRFILDCIELYHNKVRPTHSALFRFTTWRALQSEYGKTDLAFTRIYRMLKKGYSTRDFEASLLKLDTTGRAKIKLGRVVDAKNMEIDSVMLAPDLLADIQSGDRLGAGRAFAALYTGGTRARYELIVPGHLRDWASDQSARALNER